MDAKFVTACEADWPITNLSPLKVALLNAYSETNTLCHPNRSVVFSTPNQHMHTGYTRWIAVSQKLEEFCKSGRLAGIRAEWKRVSKNSGFWVLELCGKFTRLIVCHISDLENSPRDSVSRFDGRVSNQVLMNFEEEAITEQSPLLTLTLVHGHKNAEFAFIRGYNDPQRPGSYEQLSVNIMELPTVALPVEEEEIAPVEIDIADHLRSEVEEEEGKQVAVNKVAPERITQARELAGLTKSELAEEVHVSPAAIAQWENSSKQPTAANLYALSAFLKFPMPLFLKEIPRSITVRGPLTFRAWTTASSRKANRKAARMAELFAEVYLWLDERISFPNYCPPQIDDGATPESSAQQCRKSWNLSNRPILKLGELFESKGIVFGNTSFGDDRFDAFSCVINGRPFIFLGNDKKDAARSRFDACHELAHLLLHQHLTESDLTNPEVLRQIENDANAFAGAFLLPEETFSRDVMDISLDGFLKLKAKWAVSVQAMVVRAFQLGLITESQYGELFRQISGKGWRRKRGEPLDDLVPPIKRSLGQRSLELLETNKIMHAWEISSVLPMPSAILCDVFQSNPDKFEPEELGKVIPVDFKALPQAAQGTLEEFA